MRRRAETPHQRHRRLRFEVYKGRANRMHGCFIANSIRTNAGARMSPTGCKLTHRIDSGSRRSPTGCKLTHKNRFWLEEEPHRM
ncbi:hypothetical protein EVAR_4192_1 [Eumeta japonica]|uniref:Uncharacterized protein n=1 Tax=Eumeta variegata TaxID=151549 RepID=A0A4C1TGV7_EUMVA|nr:hypothetical protein EVAR_4192_1 [Eumeta japonica]